MYMLHYDPFREIRRFQRNRGLLGVGSFGDDAGRWQLHAVTHYEHGVLSVTLPKAEEKKARRLEIGTPAA